MTEIEEILEINRKGDKVVKENRRLSIKEEEERKEGKSKEKKEGLVIKATR